MNETYICQLCGKEFEKTWTDEEAFAESARLFGPMPKEELGIVCEDCFKRVMESMQ